MIAEQTPTKLIPDAIANTQIKIMHWLEDHDSFNLFAQMLNLNERQQHHARTLEPGETIVRAASGYPVLAKPPFYKAIVEGKLNEQGQTLDQYSTTNDDVKAFMQGQMQRFNLYIPEYEPWRQQRTKRAVSAERAKEASFSPDKPHHSKSDRSPSMPEQGEGVAVRIRKAQEERLRKTEERLRKG